MRSSLRTILLTALVLCIQIGLYAQRAESVDHVSMTVSDMRRAVEFYTSTLDFTIEEVYSLDAQTTQELFGFHGLTVTADITVLRLGEQSIELLEFDGIDGRAIPADSRSNDLWFQHIAIVVSNMEEAYKRVYDAGVTHVSTAPQTLPAFITAAAGITAFYFRDPDGHNLELIQYPKGKGNPRWQESNGRLFLGIDHTAIGVETTQRGLDFYREILKMTVAGNSENFGSEQEHLNQVFGARLLITGLQANAGFGVEFLDYIAPPGGRPYPSDSSPADLWHWHTTISVTDIDRLFGILTDKGLQIVSDGIVKSANTSAFLVRDRDGHAVMLRQTLPQGNAPGE